MINLPYKCYIDKNDFLNYTGVNLEKEGRLMIDDTGSIEQTIATYLNEAAEMVYNYVSTQVIDNVAVEVIMTDEAYKDIIKTAQLMQAKYMHENGNTLAVNGLNNDGTSTSLSDMRGERAYNPVMINYLNNSGLLYGGIL